MNFINLAEETIRWKKNGKQITSYDWPPFFYLDSDAKKNFEKIIKYSTSGNRSLFSRRSGSTANEYSITIGYFVDRLYYSNPIRGNYVSVVPSTSLKAIPKQEIDKAYFELTIGETKFNTPKYEVSKLQDINYGIVMVAHTHPRVYFDDDTYIHTFFSLADINFLARVPVSMLSIVTEKGVWVACKTSSSINIDPNKLSEVTRLEKEAGREAMKDYILNNLKNSGLVFYEGGLGSKIYKI